MKKRLLSLAMAAVMTFGTSGTLPLASFADSTSIVASAEGNEYKTKEGTYTYRILEDGTAEITHFVADPEIEKHDGYEVTHPVDALIPSEVNGYTVTSIAVYAFDDSGAIKSITIPSTITKINYGAFRYNAASSINVDEDNKNYCSVDGVLYNKDKTILIRFPQNKYENDDYYDEELDTFVYPDFIIPDGVEHLASWSFAYCLCGKVIMPNSLKTIGHDSFRNSFNLIEIDIPNGVFFIGCEAFENCHSLKKITLPESIKYFGENFSMSVDHEEFYDSELSYSWESNGRLFEVYRLNSYSYTLSPGSYGDQISALGDSSCFESIEVDSKNKYFSSYDGVLYNKDRTEMYYVPDAKTGLKIPKEIEKINVEGLSGIKTISVDKDNKSFTAKDNILYTKDMKTLVRCLEETEKQTIVIPDGVETIGESAFLHCYNIQSITMPSSVITLEDKCFSNCYNLTKLKLSDNITKVGYYVFSWTPWFEERQNSDKVVYIGKVLYNGDKFTGSEFVVKDGTVSIAEVALLECQDLKKITIPKSVKNIEWFAFGYKKKEDGSYGSGEYIDGFKVYCYKDSYAEKYAKTYRFDYELIDAEYSTDGDNTEIKITAGEAKDTTLTIHRDKDDNQTYALFEGVEVDGKTVDPTNYTAKSGSLNLTLKASYLSTLSVGDHTMKVLFKDGEYVSKLTVVKNTQPVRLAGAGRYATAAAISQAAFDKADTVILAYSMNYADALAGVPLAYQKNAPILLTNTKELDSATLAEIKRLGAKKVILLGGEGAIGKEVETALVKGGIAKDNIKRIAGKSRFSTATAIASQLNEKPTDVFFVYYNGFADALSASTVAARKTAPIIYLTTNGEIDADTAKYLKSIKGSVKNAYVIGGEGVISNDMATKAAKALGLFKATRVAGADRFATCVEVNKQFAGDLNGDMICVATGMNFPDALAGGVYAAKNSAPLFLINGNSKTPNLNDAQKAYLKGKNAANITAFGGEGVVPDSHIADIAKNSI